MIIENNNKFDSIDIITHINELMTQTIVTQYFKNTKNNPIELEILIPQLTNCNITKFEMTKGDQKIISKLLEKEKAKEKYNDSIAKGDYGFISYNKENETKICLGNISPGEEIELKTFFFGHIISKDLSYQATFPVVFPDFIMGDPDSKNRPEYYEYKKKIVNGKIYINTFSKLTRLIVEGSKNFDKITKKFGNDKKSAEIEVVKDNFSDMDIPGIILFRTEKINDEELYYQCDPKKNKSYYIFKKTLNQPEFNKELKEEIDEDESKNYVSLLKNNLEENKEIQKECYIFLLDQSGSMSGKSIDLSCKSLLLFLQSLNENCYFQLIGFGSDYEFFSEEPLEYNKENIENLMKTIKNLKADKGGTELYEPLNQIYNNKIYDKYEMIKNIILLTDGELFDKEKVINLIGANSSKFTFNSIGIGYCDKDLIERTALIGNGFSYYISDLNELNSVVISLLDKTQNSFKLNCYINDKCLIEDENKKILINKNDFFTHGFILDEINIKNIEINIKTDDKEIKINFDKNKIIKLPDGDNLGKLIIDNYLKSPNCKDLKTKISLSKEYKILTDETAFYAKISNEVPIKGKLIQISNKDKEASNNKEIFEEFFGYDKEEESLYEDEMKQFGNNNKNSIEDNIIRRKNFIHTLENNSVFGPQNFLWHDNFEEFSSLIRCEAPCENFAIMEESCEARCEMENCCYCCEEAVNEPIINSKKKIGKRGPYKKRGNYLRERKEKKEIIKKSEKKEKGKKREFNFDEFILGQDIIDGNWTKDTNCKILIQQEKNIYEKIQKFSDGKGIKDENGIVTLFVLYYIYNNKKDKLSELKFIINKAKKFVKKIFKLKYEDIIKEIEAQ